MIYKEMDFARFIKILEEGQVEHWIEIAEAIGVDKNTITVWKELPEAIEARQKGIKNALEQMQLSGKKDWRMWEAKLKLLNLNPVTRIELNDQRKKILEKYLDGGQTDDPAEGSSSNSA